MTGPYFPAIIANIDGGHYSSNAIGILTHTKAVNIYLRAGFTAAWFL